MSLYKLYCYVTSFNSLQIENDDDLPTLVCLQCVHQITRCYSFKQLCEQSDINLRQYLGKPAVPNKSKTQAPQQNNDFNSSLLLDNFGLDSSSEDSDDDEFGDEYLLLHSTLSENLTPEDEKAIAQKQLIKIAKTQKSRGSKKKMAKGGKTQGNTVHNIINRDA